MKVTLTSAVATAVLFAAGVISKEQPPYPGWRLFQIGDNEAAFWAPQRVAYAMAAADLPFMDITDHQEKPVFIARKYAFPDEPLHQQEVNNYIDQININNIKNNIEYFSTFENRLFNDENGAESAAWLFEQVSAVAKNRSDISVEYFNHTFVQPSIVARFTPSTSLDERVIVGAHQDSIAFGVPVGRAPGADDDASGTFTSFEAFRILIANNFVPEYPLEFHWYAGEEGGLLGSQDIAESYNDAGIPVRAMLQMDMTGYTSTGTLGLITDHTDAELNDFIRSLIKEYLQITYTDSVCGYGCSDHASWDRYGYPASFPFEAPFGKHSPYIHTPNDVVENVDFDHVNQFVRLTLGFAVELSHQ